MDYDKNSFLAGISVGMTLKGWAGGADGFGGGNSIAIIPVEYEVIDVRTYAAGAINLLPIIPVEYEVIE